MTRTEGDGKPGGRGVFRAAVAAGLAGAALGAYIGVRAWLREAPPERGLGDLAFAAVYGSPGLLVLLGSRGRPALFAAGAAAGAALAPTATPRVSAALLVVAAAALSLWLAAAEPAGRPRAPLVAVVGVAVAGVLAADVALFARVDRRCWVVRGRDHVAAAPERCRGAAGPGVVASDDVTTRAESAASLALTAGTLAGARWLAGRRRPLRA